MDQIWMIFAIDEIDSNKTFSNDLHEVYRTFGVEAARQLLVQEINAVIESSGAYANETYCSSCRYYDE